MGLHAWIAAAALLAPALAAAQERHPADRVVCDGCPQEAKREASRVIREIVRGLPAEMLSKLELRASVRVFSRHLTLLDFPEFEETRGRQIEGTPVEQLRGATLHVFSPADGSHAWSQSYVGEENLLSSGPTDALGHKSRKLLVHEYAHLIFTAALTADHVQRLRELHAQAAAGSRRFTDSYASANRTEFFAQGSEVWFGVHMGDNGGSATPEDIRRHHREFYDFLTSIYGAPRAIVPVP